MSSQLPSGPKGRVSASSDPAGSKAHAAAPRSSADTSSGSAGTPTKGPNTTRVVGALLARDMLVVRKNLGEFIPRTLLQPLLLVFVFTYVFPKIGQGIGGASDTEGLFSTILVAGVLATTIMFQGIQSTALPLVQDFAITREIEDRVLAPLRIDVVAIEKIISGSLQCLLAALLVFPIATIVPATPVHLVIKWPVLLTMVPLACISASALGLTFGTIFEPRNVPMLFGVIVVPLTFLGCTYYSWQSLSAIKWLQIAVLVNPLVYLSEGFRAAVTDVDHMPLVVIYAFLIAFTILTTAIGIRSFRMRVLK
ncbi:MAG: ABC transporter permease [Acidimicrobiia bacterium]|nr:ABC transporter permease [Acidimicrobiia bacterium]